MGVEHIHQGISVGNIDEKPYHNDKDNWAPFQVIPLPADLPGYNALMAKKSVTEAELNKLMRGVDAEVAKWLTSDTGPKQVAQKSLVTHLPMTESNGHEIKDVITGKTYKFEGAPAQIDEYPLLEGSFRLDNNTRLITSHMCKSIRASDIATCIDIRYHCL